MAHRLRPDVTHANNDTNIVMSSKVSYSGMQE